MNPGLGWHGKRFGPGDMDGAGARKLLGRPSLDPIAVLVRETAQNSWDARLRNGRPVQFLLHARRLHSSQLELLRTQVFADPGRGTALGEVLAGNTVDVLEIADRNTVGLGGPVRTAEVVDPGTPTDYRDFVLTIGARQDTERGGGTYGFGKTISYLASSASTVLIWSRYRRNGQGVSRLVGSAFGEQFVHDGARYTGRQWWGDPSSPPDPLEGPAADELAGGLFDDRFGPDETGTSLLIVAPNLRASLEETAEGLRDAVLWHLWPKMLAHPDATSPSMEIEVRLNGDPLVIPDLQSHGLLGPFAEVLQTVRAAQDGGGTTSDPMTTVDTVRYRRPPRADLGEVAITRFLADGSVPEITKSAEEDSLDDSLCPLPRSPHHVALLRHDAELVVTYRRMPRPPQPGLGLAGVFRCRPEMDDHFAAAEPPAHDGWEPDTNPDKQSRSYVRVALRRIDEAWRDQLTSEQDVRASGQSASGVVRLANSLGNLIPSMDGGRAVGMGGTATEPPTRSRSARSRPSCRVIGHTAGPGAGYASVRFAISDPDEGWSLVPKVGFGYDGGTEMATELVAGFRAVGPAATALNPAQTLPLHPAMEPEWDLVVLHPNNASLDVALQVVQLEGP